MRGTAEAITSNDADISQATYDVTPAHKETSAEAFKVCRLTDNVTDRRLPIRLEIWNIL